MFLLEQGHDAKTAHSCVSYYNFLCLILFCRSIFMYFVSLSSFKECTCNVARFPKL